MSQQLLGVLLLQFDDPGVVEADSFGALADFLIILRAVARLQRPAHQKIEINIDSPLLQLGDEKVLAVKRLKIESAGVLLPEPDPLSRTAIWEL
jgi:hypothetical protein